jgi:putative transposase
MRTERSQVLQAEPYERSEDRRGYANGFKDKTLQTRMGALKLKVPQVRGLEFYPQSLEKGSQSERALKLAVAEMYPGLAHQKFPANKTR